MIRIVFLAAFAAGALSASSITFTISAYGSGTFNGVPFTDTLVTFTDTTDTTLIVAGCFSTATAYCAPASTSNTVTLGNATYTLTDSTFIGVNTALDLAGITDLTANGDLLDETAADFMTYQMQTALPTVAGGFGAPTVSPVPTSGGPLVVTYNSESFFTATTGTASVPEPGSLWLVLTAATGLILYARRR